MDDLFFMIMDSNCVLANLLIVKAEITFDEIPIFTKAIKKKLPELYIDDTEDSIYATIDNNSRLYAIKNDRIIRNYESENFWNPDYIDKTINRKFPERAIEVFREARSSMNQL
jgi:hypothetical protein